MTNAKRLQMGAWKLLFCWILAKVSTIVCKKPLHLPWRFKYPKHFSHRLIVLKVTNIVENGLKSPKTKLSLFSLKLQMLDCYLCRTFVLGTYACVICAWKFVKIFFVEFIFFWSSQKQISIWILNENWVRKKGATFCTSIIFKG